MNIQSEEARQNGIQGRKSIGFGGGSNLASGKTRRHSSIGITSSQKSIGEEGNIVPNYLRASTGSCHDFCKFGKKHEQIKSAVPIKFKRRTIVSKDKSSKAVVSVEKKNTTLTYFTKPEVQARVEPDKLTKKDVLLILPSKKPQVYRQSSSTNEKSTKNEVKTFHSTTVVKSSPVVVSREGSNGGVKKKDVKTIKKTGITPKTGFVKKVVANVTTNELLSPRASVNRAACLKVFKSRGVKHVSPLKDQSMLHKTEPKQTIAEVKPETTEFDFVHPSMELADPSVCNDADSLCDEHVVVEEETLQDLLVVHPVSESPELFSDKEVPQELLVVKSSQSCSDEDIFEDEAITAHPVSESSESYYDDYTDDEEAEDSEDGFEASDVNEMETSVGNQKIPRKVKMVISEEKDEEGVKLRFRRGKILDLQSESKSPRRLIFRRRVIEGKEDGQNISTKSYTNGTFDLQNEGTQRVFKRSFEKKYVDETKHFKNAPESVVLKHQGEQEKKDGQCLLNIVIEETASKLVESRKSKVKALVGAFETVISLQDGKP